MIKQPMFVNIDSSVQAILLNLKSDVDLCLYDIIAHRKDVEGTKMMLSTFILLKVSLYIVMIYSRLLLKFCRR